VSDSLNEGDVSAERIGAPIPGLAEPPLPTGDAAPDLNVTPVEPPAEEPKPPREPPEARKLRISELQKQLGEAFAVVSMLVMTTGDKYCATIIAGQADALAEAWAELAKVNPRVKAILEMMLSGSAWGKVVMLTAATVIPIAAHHGVWPKGAPMPFEFGLGPPPPPSKDVKDATAAEQQRDDDKK
jgi:hypothetical protein